MKSPTDVFPLMPGATLWPTLPVIFRADIENGTLWVTAVFPTLLGTYDSWTFTIYQHIGQHGSGTRAWYNKSRAATPKEYAPLLKELRGIYGRGPGGRYRLIVTQRMTRKHDDVRKAEAKRLKNA
jgi:hypothetical protein